MTKPQRKLPKAKFRQWEDDVPRREGTTSLSSAMQKLISYLGLEKRLEEQRAAQIWHTVVGPQIAAVTTPVSVRDGVLTVKVANPTWRTELSYQSDEIIQKLNSTLGKIVVSSLKFK